jgi:glycosyltransferase involved in cell wall biosynthesis
MKATPPLISIIVPVYNVEKFLSKCIDSIINQSYRNLEIILINDGSTDNSASICREYKKKDARIKLIEKVNGGLSEARNFGIDISNGTYLSFVDSDDYIHPQMIESMMSRMIEKGADIIVCGHTIVDINGAIQSKVRDDNKIHLYNSARALNLILEDKKINSFAWDKIYKKILFKNLRYPIGRTFEDTAFTYKLFQRAKVVIQLNNSYYYYVNRANSLTKDLSPKKKYHNFLAFYERYLFALNNKLDITFLCGEKALKHGMNTLDLLILTSNLPTEVSKIKLIIQMKNIFKNINVNSVTDSQLKLKLKFYLMNPQIYEFCYKAFNKIKKR